MPGRQPGPSRSARLGRRGHELLALHRERGGVELCLFDDDGRETRIALPERTAYHWHGYLPGVGPGQRYGYRVHGPYEPERGPPLQPGQAPDRPVREGDRGPDRLRRPRACSRTRRAATTSCSTGATTRLRSRSASSIDERVRLGGTTGRSGRPWHETVIYETHVQRLHEAAPRRARAICAARTPASPPTAIEHLLRSLGVTAVELLPDPPHRRRGVPARPRAHELLGLLHGRLPRAARAATRRRARAASRSASSRGWSRRSIAPASR